MKLSSKREDYLETIFRLSDRIDAVGVSDIAKARGVTLPTVISAISKLKKDGLVNQRHYGKIVLTHEGKKKAAEVYQAHSVLRLFLGDVLGLPEEMAEAEACKMEHGLSPETLGRMKIFIRKILENRASVRNNKIDNMPIAEAIKGGVVPLNGKKYES
jgi:DtxR family Mn-dependent transcriptional regulator